MNYNFNDLREEIFSSKLKENKKIFKLIEYASKSGYFCYTKNLQKWQLTFAPMHYDDNIIADFSQSNEKNENDLLNEVISSLNYSGAKISEKNEKYDFYNTVKNELYKKMDSHLINNEFFFLIAMSTNIEYNMIASFPSIDWLEKQDENNEIADNFSRNLVKTLTMSKLIPNVDENEIFLRVQQRFAADKIAIQKVVQYILSEYKIKIPNKINIENVEFVYNMVLNYSRAIALLESIHTMSLSNVNKNSAIEIDKDGKVNISGDTIIWDNKERFVKGMKKNTDLINNNLKSSQFDNLVKEFYGVSYSHLETYFANERNEYDISPDQYMIGTKSLWINVLSRELEIEHESAMKLFARLVHSRFDNMKGKLFTPEDTRLLRNPLIQIGSYFLCPFGLLNIALVGHYTDIRFGMTQVSEMNKEIEKVIKDEDLIFEEKLANYITEKFDIKYIKYNVEQNDIKGKNNMLKLLGQIDIMFVKNEVLYIIEAKNSRFKFSPKAVEGEGDRFLKYRPKSYQYKLDKKVQIISNNLFIVKNYLNVPDNYSIREVRAFFVTNEFIKGSLFKESLYPIININELERLFETQI